MPSSDGREGVARTTTPSTALLSYQTRLLENSSLSRAPSLSRSNSQTASILGPNVTRRWNPSHRSAASADLVRDRAKHNSVEVPTGMSPSWGVTARTPDSPPILASPDPVTPSDGRLRLAEYEADKPLPVEPPQSKLPFQRSPLPQEYQAATSPAAPLTSHPVRRHQSSASVDSVRGRWEERVKEAELGRDSSVRIPRPQSTLRPFPESRSAESPPPTPLKRRTLPTAITPDSVRDQWERKSKTGESSEPRNTQSSFPDQSTERSTNLSRNYLDPASERSPTTPVVHKRRTIPSFEDLSFPAKSPGPFNNEPKNSLSSRRTNSNSTASLKSSSIPDVKELGELAVFSASPTRAGTTQDVFGTARGNKFDSNTKDTRPPPPAPMNASVENDAVHSSPHRSSYMRKREQFSTLGNKRLGNHLPRIASGDAEDETETSTRKREVKYAPLPSPQFSPSRSGRGHIGAELRHSASPKTETLLGSPVHGDFVVPTVTNAETVAGKPDRKRLSKQDLVSSAPSSPNPSARLTRGLWADVQRHLLHAYEYLCHVGEAQQWIEGCLDEELGFGVVDMEEGLRNGVVLAKLVRVWEGDAVVRKIFEHPKLQYRHSDNINIFLDFVRRVGLPESFIFEFTDLYNKKNIPKVIYCIHALAHFLARRGMARRIGNLIGRLQFSDDQLQKTQKGLNDSGVPMPNFGGVGRELAKEINEEPEEEPETEEERRDRLLMENKDSIIGLQALLRGALLRKRIETRLQKLRLQDTSVVKLQGFLRGALIRRQIETHLQKLHLGDGYVVGLQASLRGALIRKRVETHLQKLRLKERYVVRLQASLRGALIRKRVETHLQKLRLRERYVVRLQALLRGSLIRRQVGTHLQELHLRERYVVRLQAKCRGLLIRLRVASIRSKRLGLQPWTIAMQSQIRGLLVRRAWNAYLRRVKGNEASIVLIQARARGFLERRRYKGLKGALRSSKFSVVGLQAMARAKILRRTHTEAVKVLQQPRMQVSWLALQAQVRGTLVRRNIGMLLHRLDDTEPCIIEFQSHCRAALLRRRVRGQLQKLDDAEDVITRIQSVCRAILARRRLLGLIRALRHAVPAITGLQAIARARLGRQRHVAMNKALAQSTVVTSVAGMQTLARAALTRKRLQQQSKQLEFVMPDVVGLQSSCRGALVRDIYRAWRDHLHDSHDAATFLQALLRGATERRKYRAKLAYFQANLQKVVKIQSLFRAKEQREQYRQLTMGTNVTAGTIKNFVHLLDDSEADFEEEIAIERLRKRVVESIRENQALETEVSELDVKIALVVQNVKSFEDLIKTRRHGGDSTVSHAAKSSILAAHGDPFSGSGSLDHATKRRLELYQQLFYLLQTKSDYFARLFFHLTRADVPEKTLRMTERVVLTIFGYGQDLREDFLLLQLLKMSIHEEIGCSPLVSAIANCHPFYEGVVVHYVRPRQVTYVKDVLQVVIQDMLEQEDLDLETDPLLIYRNCINEEEMRTGRMSHKRKDVTFKEAVEDPDARPRFIRNLQQLQVLADVFLRVLVGSTRKMPYGMRFVAHETLAALRARFPNQPPLAYATTLGHFIYHRYIHPAITNPETFDLAGGTMSPQTRKNLAAISKVLSQIASGQPFGDEDPVLQSLNSYVSEAIDVLTNWFIEVAEVEAAETHFHAHEFLDATVQPKPIYISPNEVYAMHSLLAQHVNILAAPRDDPLRLILTELDGVPNLGSEELKDARDRAVTLELTNRFADVRDPHANEKAIWVQAKRGVLAVLRVQPAANLVESLVEPVADEHEELWEEIVNTELVYNEMQEQRHGRQPSANVNDTAYRLQDIRTLSYADVKEHALFYLLELERLNKVTRADGYQDVLNVIAADLRSKHRRRIRRRQEMDAMNDALKHLNERKASYKEQIASYNNYVDSAMSTLQRGKGKKRFVMPFTKQFFHLRELQRSGKTPQFGSYIYSAQELYDKGILLSIDQFSPRQFDRLDMVLESNEIGIFTIKVTNTTNGITTEVATQELRMEDLLQANFEGRVSLSLFDGMAKVNLNLLLFQINKKFYV